MNKPSLRALLVDDHHLMIDALKVIVNRMGTFDRIESANSLHTACAKLEADPRCDVAILDLNLGETNGRETLLQFREKFPDVAVLVFSGDASIENIAMAFECGARGFVTKRASPEVIQGAISLVMAGGIYIPPDSAAILGLSLPQEKAPAERPVQPLRFSGRQKEVFDLLLQGMPNKIIAARLDIAEGTAKAHLNSVFRVLGVRTRVEAILRAQQLGLV